MTTLRIGIASLEQFRDYTMAIARGEHKRAPNEPKLWCSSIDGFAKLLSDRNRELLRLIRETKPQSLDELAEATGWPKADLSRTLKTLERYGLVHFRKGKGRAMVPRTPYTRVVLHLAVRTPTWARYS
jgi:predicted transcriptional regulator